MYMATLAIEASMMMVGHLTKRSDPKKNELQLTDDIVKRLKNEFTSNNPNVVFSHVLHLDDDMERPVEMCSLEMFLSHDVKLND